MPVSWSSLAILTTTACHFEARLYDVGRHAVLLKALPGLLADAHTAARSRQEMALARLSTTYTLTAQVLTKIGHHERARLSADRTTTYAEWSAPLL